MKNKTSTLLARNASGDIVCRYKNKTAKLQIIRTSNVGLGAIERTIFPGSQLMFEVRPDAFLEVSTYETPTSILSDRIPCIQLRYRESLALLKASLPVLPSVPSPRLLSASCR